MRIIPNHVAKFMTQKKPGVLGVLLATSLTMSLTGCFTLLADDGEGDGPTSGPVAPEESDDLTSVLLIPGSTRSPGNPPPPSGSPSSPTVGNNQTSASISAGNILYLPFTFDSADSSSPGYGGCYVQVDGASSYFDIPDGDTSATGQLVVPITVPSNVENGDFCLNYCVYDNSGQVSNVLQTCVAVREPQGCASGNVTASGSDGLTITSVEVGGATGLVTVSYDTYSIPDRIDVFYGSTWQAGTGSSLGAGQAPPPTQCSDAANVDGYVGASGTLSFQADGSESVVNVYSSGCIGDSTAWDISLSCPE